MTNEEILEAMWGAYRDAANRENTGGRPPHVEKEWRNNFDIYVKEHFPKLLEPTTYKHFDIVCRCDEHTPYDKSKGCCCYD